ncbi:MAG: hypothetical protein AAFU85_32770, partial [Planctomycetota bacterium]
RTKTPFIRELFTRSENAEISVPGFDTPDNQVILAGDDVVPHATKACKKTIKHTIVMQRDMTIPVGPLSI